MDDFRVNFDHEKRHNEPRLATFSFVRSFVRSHRSFAIDRDREEGAKHGIRSLDVTRGPSRERLKRAR